MTKIRKRSKRQTIIYKTLHRKLKIKRREIPPPQTGLSFPAPQVTPVVLLLNDPILIWYYTILYICTPTKQMGVKKILSTLFLSGNSSEHHNTEIINSCAKSAWYARRQHSYNICKDFLSDNSGMKNWNFSKKYTDRQTINSNKCAKFEVNWPKGSQFTARHTKNRLQFDE